VRKGGKKAVRFSRETWLQVALEVLAREGQAKLRVERLSAQLGVTRGSFYHHFGGREDFVQALVAFWSSAFTDKVNAEVSGSDLPARERLLFLMRLIHRNKLDRYDIAFRSWAAQESSVAKYVRKVDATRFQFVRSIFTEMGFKGTDLDDRVRLWLVYQCAQRTVYFPGGFKDNDDSITRRHAFLTRPSPSE
jgi:AcrR family transcriptional regulator